jgi:hypothetical protein
MHFFLQIFKNILSDASFDSNAVQKQFQEWSSQNMKKSDAVNALKLICEFFYVRPLDITYVFDFNQFNRYDIDLPMDGESVQVLFTRVGSIRSPKNTFCVYKNNMGKIYAYYFDLSLYKESLLGLLRTIWTDLTIVFLTEEEKHILIIFQSK